MQWCTHIITATADDDKPFLCSYINEFLYEIVKFIPKILQYGHMAETSGEQACCEIGGEEWQSKEMQSLLEFITAIADTLKKIK